MQYNITALFASFRIAYGVKQRGILAQAYQRSRLIDSQVARFLIEIDIGSSLDADSIVQEVEVVEVHRDDFLFGEVSLQFDGYHPLDRLLQNTLNGAVGFL